MVNNDNKIEELIKAKYGSFSKLRTQINNKIHSMIEYGGAKGKDQGVILEEVVNQYAVSLMDSSLGIGWKQIAGFIFYRIHDNSYN